MKCPQCKNRNFEPTEDVKKPLKNLGCKENYDQVNYRRYACLQCGYAFVTSETFERELNIRRNKQVELFLERKVA